MLVQDIRVLGEPDGVARILRDLKNVFMKKIKHCNWPMFVT